MEGWISALGQGQQGGGTNQLEATTRETCKERRAAAGTDSRTTTTGRNNNINQNHQMKIDRGGSEDKQDTTGESSHSPTWDNHSNKAT